MFKLLFLVFLICNSFICIYSQLDDLIDLATGKEPVIPACTRPSYGRGAGYVLTPQCKSDEEVNGAMCYPKCKEGFEPVGCCICRRKGCPSGFQQTGDGASCAKSAPYGRNGYPWKFGDPLNQNGMYSRCQKDHGQGNCETWGAVVYPKCKAGYYAFACCVCTPQCPSGYKDMGALCLKETYGRGVGYSRLGCTPPLEQQAALCYDKCKKGMHGVGPVCWGACNKEFPNDCGVFCTRNALECAKLIAKVAKQAAKFAVAVVQGGIGVASGNILQLVKTIKSGAEVGKALYDQFKNIKFCVY